MSNGEMYYLFLVLAAFAVFMSVLAYGTWLSSGVRSDK